MKQLLSTLLLGVTVIAPLVTQAQKAKTEGPVKPQVFSYVEQMPEFNGDLPTYLQRNLRYPEAAKKDKLEGRVTMRFTIDHMGAVRDINAVRSPHPLLTAEAERVIREMPNWKPGMQDGKPVAVYFTLPVKFELKNQPPAPQKSDKPVR